MVAVQNSFAATGVSDSFGPEAGESVDGSAPFNISLWGAFVGTVQLERSFDGGATWLPKTPAALYQFTAPASFVDEEPEYGVRYRLNCTAYTSGTINYRLSR